MIKKKDRKRECLAIPRKNADILTICEVQKGFSFYFCSLTKEKKRIKSGRNKNTLPPSCVSCSFPFLPLTQYPKAVPARQKRAHISKSPITPQQPSLRFFFFLGGTALAFACKFYVHPTPIYQPSSIQW